MLLTVIVPEKSKGIGRMLEKELGKIEHEIIEKRWSPGLKSAQGDFIVLLEDDSAISPATIRKNLAVFLNNPSYRKLAMVSSMVDFAQNDKPISFTFEGGKITPILTNSSAVHSVRVGYLAGAVIRRSSLMKCDTSWLLNPLQASVDISLDFWTHGLRVALNPDSLYYAPEGRTYPKKRFSWMLDPKVLMMWEREMIA